MSTLNEYNPLNKIKFQEIEIVNPKGIYVIVGPNSSGKTLFLKDIESYLMGQDVPLKVCSAIFPNQPKSYDQFVEDLIKKNMLKKSPNNTENYRTYTPFLNKKGPKDNARPEFPLKTLQSAFSEVSSSQNSSAKRFFSFIGLVLCSFYSLGNRISVCDKCDSFDHKSQTPDDPIQGLFLNSDAQEKLSNETGKVFGNSVWLDSSEKKYLQLRTSDGPKLPTSASMTNPLSAEKYPLIDQEGDGFKSYVGMGLSLLMAQKPVSLIDEPEMCLHPPQAYHMGRFIGENSSSDHVTFVSTHSSQILRGILETGKDVKVLRLTRKDCKFNAHLVHDLDLLNCQKSPRAKSESILDGLFSKSVILVESEGDREVYSAASEAIIGSPSHEVHFVSVGGVGGFLEPVRFYKATKIPMAIISDIDAVFKVDQLKNVFREILSDCINFEEFIRKLNELSNNIKSKKPEYKESEIQDELREISNKNLSWESGDDNKLVKDLSLIIDRIKRSNPLKKGGVESFQENPMVYGQLKEIIKIFSDFGFFLVPVGELENWTSHPMIGAPKNGVSKLEKATKAAAIIRSSEKKEGGVWDFIADIYKFLNK